MQNKRGLIHDLLIFLVLNLIFFSVMSVFVWQSSSGKLIYSQAYAKQIALIIDKAKAETTVMLNVDDAIEAAKKNNIPLENVFKIDSAKKMVYVDLGRTKFAYPYFSELKAEGLLQSSGSVNLYVIKIMEKT